MPWQIRRYEIIAECDIVGCCARQIFSSESKGRCLREAKDAGWKLRYSRKISSSPVIGFQGTCRCPGHNR